MKKLLSLLTASALLLTLSTAVLAAELVDEEMPGDVEGVVVTPLDSAVLVEWDETTDNFGVEGYFVFYGLEEHALPGLDVAEDEEPSLFFSLDGLTDNFEDAGNDVEYTVEGLENGSTYYFSVVAYDAAANESEHWGETADEESVITSTPEADLGMPSDDEESPEVIAAEALNREEVSVTFSEDVVLPADAATEFGILNDDTFEPLDVIDAVLSTEDASVVILSTADQEEFANYIVTAGVDVKDAAGNPIVNGFSDTALFEGSGAEKVTDEEMPSLLGVEVVDATHIMLSFSETIVLTEIDPSEHFVIVSDDEMQSELGVLGVSLETDSEGVEDAIVILVTEAQGAVDYQVLVAGVTDNEGNEIGAVNSAVFTGDGAAEDPIDDPTGEDTTPPSDVANFVATKVMEAEKYFVTLKWTQAVENADDTVQQLLSLSTNGSDYDNESTFDGTTEEYNAGEMTAGEYWFKLTQVDAAGNESDGVIAKVLLSETGPGLIGLVVFSLGMGRVVGRKRRK